MRMMEMALSVDDEDDDGDFFISSGEDRWMDVLTVAF